MRVRELTAGQEIDQVLLVRASDRRRLVLGDRTGTLEAVAARGRRARVVRAGRGARRAARAAHDRRAPRAPRRTSTHSTTSLDGPRIPVERMEADLRALIATVQCDHLRALLDAVFGPGTETWELFREAPAAKRYHQAYRHGLLEHSLDGRAERLARSRATFGGVDRDVAVTGALLHDIGKLDAYTSDPLAIDMTDLGKLQGEIPLGYYRVRRLIEDLPGFPSDLAVAVLHIILSHHGQLEHGSPVVPCTREATLVHMIDNLGGKLGSFDRLEKELPDGSSWSGWDRVLGGGAWFGAREAA